MTFMAATVTAEKSDGKDGASVVIVEKELLIQPVAQESKGVHQINRTVDLRLLPLGPIPPNG